MLLHINERGGHIWPSLL